MSPEAEILRLLGFPENPVGTLEMIMRSSRSGSAAGRDLRRRLVSAQMILQHREFAVHPGAWQAYVSRNPLPASFLPEAPPSPEGWPVPVFLERAGCGGVAHLAYELSDQQEEGHRLDLSGPLEAFLQCCANMGEPAFPDQRRFPLAARVRPRVRLDGRSWELPCLIGYFARHSGTAARPVFATGSVGRDGVIQSGDMLEEKIQGWLREVGPGQDAIVLGEQNGTISRFRSEFGELRVIQGLEDLVMCFRDRGWLQAHQHPPDPLRCERMLRESRDWHEMGRSRMGLLTLEALERHRNLLTARQEVLWLGEMHYLNSCFGRFKKGLAYLREMEERLGERPQLLDPDERAVHLAKAAVQLYDAHLFQEAVELLEPLLQKDAQGRISQISRAKVLGTLGQVLTAMGRWEEGKRLLQEAVEIFKEMDPLEVSRSYHYLIHNRLRAGRLAEASRLLQESQEWVEGTDTYGSLFRTFYSVELDRGLGRLSQRPALPEGYRGLIHPYCFALQAWARNPCHPLAERLEAITEASERLDRSFQDDGVLRFLALSYRLYGAALRKDPRGFRDAAGEWNSWVEYTGGEAFMKHYGEAPSDMSRGDAFASSLMQRIPYH